MAQTRERLDEALTRRGLAPTRTKAQALVMAGTVWVDGERMEKSGARVAPDAAISVKEKPHPYVSRGGVKLQAALDAFDVYFEGMRCLDIGASTGGFTHCLLLRSAAHVTALDVGKGQLDASLRHDPRVTVLEGINARYLNEVQLGRPFDVVVMDVSFISVRKIIPHFSLVLEESGNAVVLIKPQFELKKGEVGKGGIVRDAALHDRVLLEISEFIKKESFHLYGSVPSPIRGAGGNKEFFVHFGPEKRHEKT